MAKRSSAKPLYELMLPRRDKETRAVDVAEARRPRLPAPDQLIGRTIRVPMGYLLLGAGGVLLLLVVAYMVGYWRGDRAVQAEYERRYLEATGAGRARDPLQDPGTEPGDSTTTDEAPTPPLEVVARPQPTLPAAWGPVESDPRRPGRYYLVLAETRPSGGLRLAEFCRTHEVEAYVVAGHNARLRRVIVLPGFLTRSTSDEAVRGLLEKIDRIGMAWKSEHRGESDLKDAYMSLYEG